MTAPSLLLTWGLPAGAVLLLALLLLNRMAGVPLEWAEQQVGDALAVVENPVLTPVRAGEGEPPAGEVSAQSDGASNGALTLVTPTDTPTAQPPTDTPQAPATPTASPFPTETATATLTNTPSATAMRQSVAISDTQTITATLTSAGTVTDRIYTVQEGDTAFSIANRFQVTVAELLTINQLSPVQALQLKPGTSLKIPGSGPLVDAVPTATPTNSVPTATATSTQTATPFPTAIPWPTFTPTPTATLTPTTAIRVNAPIQIDPAHGVNIQCNENQNVKWSPVEGLWPGDEYVFFLGYVNSAPDADGKVVVVPLLEQHTEQRINLVLDSSYCSLASQDFGRRWRWYVQLFNGDTPVSPPSPVWEFTWR